MRPVVIAGVANTAFVAANPDLDETEMVEEVTRKALAEAGLQRSDVGFVCSGSSDWVMGRAFSFVQALEGVGAWPPIRESHVEMDGAWALYEAWLRLQHGDVDVAVVYAYGRSSYGPVDDTLTLQLDPYTSKPLEPDPLSLAALQARLLLDRGHATEADFAAVVAAARGLDTASLLQAPYASSPLRAHDAPFRTDGAAAVVLRVGTTGGPRIAGIAHLVDSHHLGLRDLGDSASTRNAAARAGGTAGVEVAELHAPYSAQVTLLARALGLGPEVRVNPSGGALVADTPMVSGLMRIIEATRAVRAGARVALAHASTGPCLQHNLVCRLEAS
jgi:acetyl-CoA acetyltransferase